eukprot:TRINITY_DN2020_c0_g1_i2.p1 TRINITY_DN2020_c0_g1~~TRINITY_DN2020_c0_g1_i2.p1  ORF type:complete len:404 (+),score=77.65 TRINITY_DN2020_c0_g1_i2:110-1321(+)
MTEIELPETVGKEIEYSQLKFISQRGEGGFAVVYKAQYKDEIVAVKQWRVNLQDFRRQDLLAFQRELDSNRLFNHPNIVHFIGACLGPICIVTEYVEGRDMWEVVHDESDSYDWRKFRQMALETAAGMGHIHQQGQVHRDLKSLNLLVDRQYHVKICDFGLAKFTDKAIKMTGGRGTTQWMAPEVLRHLDYDGKADVYSYGIVLWELCARDVPYKDYTSDYKIAEAVALKHERPAMPIGIPPAVAKLIQACWSPAVSDRPTFAEIQRVIEDENFIPAQMLDIPILTKNQRARMQEEEERQERSLQHLKTVRQHRSLSQRQQAKDEQDASPSQPSPQQEQQAAAPSAQAPAAAEAKQVGAAASVPTESPPKASNKAIRENVVADGDIGCSPFKRQADTRTCVLM